jgi:hypothetical protein
VTFENYFEGKSFGFGSSFTDLATDVTFLNPRRGTETAGFSIEYGAARDGIPALPGHYLAIGVAPGDAISLSTNFGFDANLPRGARHVSMDVLVTGDSGSLTLTGFDSAGLPIASSTISPIAPLGEFTQAQIGIDTPLDSIRSISVSVTGLSVGYDNLTFTPEPSSTAVILGVLAFATRRPKR